MGVLHGCSVKPKGFEKVDPSQERRDPTAVCPRKQWHYPCLFVVGFMRLIATARCVDLIALLLEKDSITSTESQNP